MTDFMSSLLASMATKFNEATENIKIDLTEDKTMKWRGLLNNKFAAGRRGERTTKRTGMPSGSSGGEGLSTSSAATVLFADSVPSQSTCTSDKTTVDVDNSQLNSRAADKTKRVLRRKKTDNIEKKMVQPRRRKRRAKASEIPSSDLIEIGSSPAKRIKRSGRLKKPNANTTIAMEESIKLNQIEMTVNVTKPQLSDTEGEIVQKLRRSERVQSECFVVEHIPTVIVDECDPTDNSQINNCELPKEELNNTQYSPKNEQKNHFEKIELRQRDGKTQEKELLPPLEAENANIFIEKNLENEQIEHKIELKDADTVVLQENDDDCSALKSDQILQIKNENEDATEAKPSVDGNSNTVIPPVHIPKKRGRKPGTKLKPKIDQLKASGIAVKKSLRLSKDSSNDSVLASAMARREKINEQIAPPQRLSRRIKPTAKILANEELRYGFELQNNARLSISSNDQQEKTPERSPKGQNGQVDETSSSFSTKELLKTESVLKNESNFNEHSIQFRTPPSRRPCPDPIEFLNEIKLAKINLHRSPEDNKKLNFKQKRRLFKLKEKHLNKLGLQKTAKSSNDSSVESSESDDVEEFVPNKKINVGRPSITLRIRSQRDESQKLTVQCTNSARSININNDAGQSKRGKVSNKSKTELGESSRSYERNLLLSTKHKRLLSKQESLVNAPASPSPLIKREQVPTICLCNKFSKYYTEKAPETAFCQAVDEMDSKYIGCSNEITGNLIHLLRPSVRVTYMILCDDHKKRLIAHNCCAGCGIFCTQGRFFLCSQNHVFHRNCATKFILNSPFNQQQNHNFSYPTLVLRCPHCGIDAPNQECLIKMSCRTAPVFSPTQRGIFKSARLSIDLRNIKEISKNEEYLMELEKLIPDSILNLVSKAQNNFPFSCNHNYTTKDVFYAVHKNDIDRIAEIIAGGFDITVALPEYHNGTSLHLVSNSGSINLVYLILSRSSSVDFLNVVDKELRSAVMCAVVSNRNDILKVLVQCGADVTLKGSDGMTALHFAAKIGNLEAIRIILENYKRKVNTQKFEEFLNACDDGGWTAIVWAAENGHSDLVIYFVQCGSETSIRDAENNTVLHWAMMSDDTETIVPLLQEHYDFNIQNINGDTPLHIACRNSNTQLCLMLLVRGASLDIKNAAGEIPFDCIPNENSSCARVVQFNMSLRKLARFGERTIICQDISNGREYYPIKVVKKSKQQFDISTEIDECALPDFKYISKTILLQNAIQIDQRISQMRICSCSDNCTTQSCQCSEISVQNWYNPEGRLNGNFNYRDPAMIFECNDVCGCNKLLCKNRVVQKGTKCPLQIIECDHKSKGWGVIGLTKILKGTFVAEYTGEILTDIEADRRTDDSYFFDLGASEHCIDANYYGNISRFFNHSCDPNIVPIRVYFEHQDLRFPKIAFFACRDIDAGVEITFDYGEKFWLNKYKSFTCQCGVPDCRFSAETINKTLDEYNQRLARPSN